MATVILPDELEKLIGENNLTVEAGVFRDVMAQLLRRYPRLKASSLEQMAVAIDEVIVVDPFSEQVSSGSTGYFVHFVTGGWFYFGAESVVSSAFSR